MAKNLKMQMKLETSMTLEEEIKEFYCNCESRNLRPSTNRYYKDSVRQIYKICPPETKLNVIDEDFWDSYKMALRKKHL